jgi:cell division protein ZapA
MGQVVVTVNGRAFPLSCADGEEARTRRLAQYLDGKVTDFVKVHGQIGEARLILLAALVVCDELSDTSDAFQQERSRPHSNEAGAAVQGIRAIAQRIDAIAERLETS